MDKMRAYYKKYNEEHREERRELNRRYWAENRETLIPKNSARTKVRRRENPSIRMAHNMRERIRRFFIGTSKSAKTVQLLGCSWDQFRVWMQWQIDNFRPDLCMDKYGPEWHLDHVIPCSRFWLRLPSEQQRCFHWSNYQPLLGQENLEKQDEVNLHDLFKHELKVAVFLRQMKDFKLREKYDVRLYLPNPV
jgi:hypothetical protein